MAVPGKHDSEPTAEIQGDLYGDWVNARKAAAAWKAEESRLRHQLEAQLNGAFAGTVFGRKVVTYRPQENYAVKALQDAFPELTQHYMAERTEKVFDLEAFLLVHKDLAEPYRVRSFKLVADATEKEES